MERRTGRLNNAPTGNGHAERHVNEKKDTQMDRSTTIDKEKDRQIQ